jgi:Na+/H+ antiporter NhaC
MGVAIAILFLAWMIGDGCKQLGTAPYLSEFIGGHLAPQLLPVALFLLGAGIAFATGSSWSTMSILLPLVVGLAYTLGEQTPELGGHALLILSIGAVLEGSIFGDHCSPLSDTTVLSSTASATDLMDHVHTQLPYALLAMGVSVLCGYLPSTFLGWSPWACLALGIGALLLFLALFGRRSEAASEARPA